MDGIENDPRELLKRLAKKNAIWIDRVPKKTKEDFKAFAFQDFEGDYGMALKWLWDYYAGYMVTPESQMKVMIGELHERIAVLEGKPSEQVEEKNIRLGDGSRIERRNQK